MVSLAARSGLWCDRLRAAELFLAMAWAELLLRRLRARTEEEGRGRGRGRQSGGERVGTRGGIPTKWWGWSAAARPTPAYGRHVAAAEWGKAGAARGRERGGGGRPGCWLGRKGGGSAQQRLSPFLFLKLFSQIISKFIWVI